MKNNNKKIENYLKKYGEIIFFYILINLPNTLEIKKKLILSFILHDRVFYNFFFYNNFYTPKDILKFLKILALKEIATIKINKINRITLMKKRVINFLKKDSKFLTRLEKWIEKNQKISDNKILDYLNEIIFKENELIIIPLTKYYKNKYIYSFIKRYKINIAKIFIITLLKILIITLFFFIIYFIIFL